MSPRDGGTIAYTPVVWTVTKLRSERSERRRMLLDLASFASNETAIRRAVRLGLFATLVASSGVAGMTVTLALALSVGYSGVSV